MLADNSSEDFFVFYFFKFKFGINYNSKTKYTGKCAKLFITELLSNKIIIRIRGDRFYLLYDILTWLLQLLYTNNFFIFFLILYCFQFILFLIVID